MDFNKLLDEMKSKYKDEVILGLAEEETFEVKCIPTGLIGVDYVIGRPGIPAWRITQIAGFEDSGKSLLAQQFLISFQKRYENGIPVLFNTEYAFDKDFFVKLGGNIKRLLIFTPKTIERVFEILENLVKTVRKKYGKEPHILAVIDSLSAAVEYEIEKGEYQPGVHARVLSHIFRKIRSQLYDWNATLVYISQNKEKISMLPFGGGIARLGGHAVEFAPVLTLEIKRIKEEKDDNGDVSFIYFKLKATKNHVAIPFRELDLLFDMETLRFRNSFNILHFLVKKGLIEDKGRGWYEYQNKKYRRKELMQVLEEDKEIEFSLRKELNIDLNEEILL